MRRIVAITQVTLDGVMQAPGGPEEDPSNGFTHGGWAMPFVDAAANRVIDETIAVEFDMLLGRRTYNIFASYWPHQGENPIAKAFNPATKYVVTHRSDRLDWQNSQRIAADADRRRSCRRISPVGFSAGARQRKAAVRTWRAATRSLARRNCKHAARLVQHLQAGMRTRKDAR